MGGRVYRFDYRSGGGTLELGGSTWIGTWGIVEAANEDKGGTARLVGMV